MSRPYISINSSSYNASTDVVSLEILALRLRGQSSITIGGFTQSKTISLTDGFYSDTFTFSANVNGTTASGNADTVLFTPATRVFELSGTTSGTPTETNIKITIWSEGNNTVLGAGGYTFSTDKSASDAVVELHSNLTLPAGISATTSGASLIFSAPNNTGAYYNGNVARIESTSSLGNKGLTFSSSYHTGVWEDGVTTLTIPVSTTDFGQLDDIVFNITSGNQTILGDGFPN